jgi:hypothetical protein
MENESIENLKARISQLEYERDMLKASNQTLRAEIQTYKGIERGSGFEIANQMNLTNIQLTDAINAFLESSRHRYNQSQQQANHWIETIHQVDALKPLKSFVDAIVSLATTQYASGTNVLQNNLKYLREQYDLPKENMQAPDFNIQLLVTLEEAAAFIEATVINNNTVGLLTRAHDFSHVPGCVCHAILEELKSKEDLSLETVARLDPAWIEENLTLNPSIKLLREGLKSAWDQSMNGPKQADFCKKHNINPRNFRYHRSWLKKVQQSAISPSEFFKAPFPE